MPFDKSKPNPSETGHLAGEIWGGFASMLVALPSSIAYGVAIYTVLGADYIAQGAMAGILGAIAIGLLAPVFGGSPRLISAPCAPAAMVMAALAADLVAGTRGTSGPISPQQVVLLMTLVAVFSGGLQFVYGSIGGGRLIKYIPYPVVSGYLSGVGVLIFIADSEILRTAQRAAHLGRAAFARGIFLLGHLWQKNVRLGRTALVRTLEMAGDYCRERNDPGDAGRAQSDEGGAGDDSGIAGRSPDLFWSGDGLARVAAFGAEQTGG